MKETFVVCRCSMVEKAMFKALAREKGYSSVSEMIRRELLHKEKEGK